MQPKFEVYQDAADEWRWRLIAANGQIVATSGEGYSSPGAATAGTQVVRRISTDALVEQLKPTEKPEAKLNRTASAVDKLRSGFGRQEVATPPSPEPKVRPSLAAPPPLAGNPSADSAAATPSSDDGPSSD
jgi:uncharacterized protein YegP (UPF0339 family)